MHTESPFCHGVCKKGIPYVLRWQFSTQFHAFHQLPYSPEKIGFQFTDWHRVAVKDAAEKFARDAELEKGCLEALTQIETMRYDAKFRLDGMDTIIKYGIACDRKRCKVMILS